MTLATDVAADLRDSGNAVFTSPEINAAIVDALREFSLHVPRETPETLYTIANSRLVDISVIPEDELIYGYSKKSFNPAKGVEYKTGQSPRQYQNFNIEPDEETPYIEMDLYYAPTTDDEEVKVRCYKFHTEDTISAGDYGLLKTMSMYYVLKHEPLEYLNAIMSNSSLFTTITGAISNIYDRLEQSIDDLEEGRVMIGDERDDASSEIELAAQAINDIIVKITQAEQFFNSVNLGQPELDYFRSAGQQGQAASLHMQKARAHLSLEATSQSWRQQAIAELQIAAASLSQLRASSEHIRTWIATINLSKDYGAMADKLWAEIRTALAKRAPHKGRSLSKVVTY